MSATIRRSPGIRITELPRLADAAIWTGAAFEHANPEAILGDQPTWQGSATQLLQALQSANVLNFPRLPEASPSA